MKSQNSAAKSVKTKSKPAVKQNIAEAGLSLESVFAALRKRYPAAAAQAQAVAFATAFYSRMEADEFTLQDFIKLLIDLYNQIKKIQGML